MVKFYPLVKIPEKGYSFYFYQDLCRGLQPWIPTDSKQKVAVVTGRSSGIGHEISLTLARNGFTTYATMRNLQKSSDLKSIAEDENCLCILFRLMLQMTTL